MIDEGAGGYDGNAGTGHSPGRAAAQKDRAFTALVLAVIALGVGANTALFSLLNATLFRPLPIDRPEELVSLFTVDGRNPGRLPSSHLNVLDYRERSTDFAGITAYTVARSGCRPAAAATRRRRSWSPGITSPCWACGRRSAGRSCPTTIVRRARIRSPSSVTGSGSGGSAAISAIVGKSITINRFPFTIVGVAPQGFTGVDARHRRRRLGADDDVSRGADGLRLVQLPARAVSRRGRPAPARHGPASGAGRPRRLSRQLQQEHPAENDRRSTALVPLLDARLDPNGNRSILAAVGLLYTVVGIVLLDRVRQRREPAARRAAPRGGARLPRGSRSAPSAGGWCRQLLTESLRPRAHRRRRRRAARRTGRCMRWRRTSRSPIDRCVPRSTDAC